MHQDAGRGRQGRSWVSVDGNFYGSTLVELQPQDPAAQTLSLASGLALLEAIHVSAPVEGLVLKWPNDLMQSGRKLAGILLERSNDRVAVGFGVNLASAPKLADRVVSSLGGKISPQAFAPLLAASFGRMLDRWRRSEPALIVQAWLERAHPIGTRLRVHSSAEQELVGRFEGLELDGGLRLRLEDGSFEIVRAGDVEL